MPETYICIHCRKPIDQEDDEWVVTNKDRVRYEDKWLYAHASCQKENAEKEQRG